MNKPETKKKQSDSKKGNTNALGHRVTEESKKKMSNSCRNKTYATHIQWHLSRGIINVDCQHCIEQVMKEHS